MKRRQKRPRSFYARLARARGVPMRTVYLELNPDKRPRMRAQESDDWLPWSRLDLVRMDRAFCDAMRRAIARGRECARAPAPKPAAYRLPRRFDPAPLRSGATSPAEMCAEIGERDPFFDVESGEQTMDAHAPIGPKARTTFYKVEQLRALALQMLAATPAGLTADEIAARLGESVLAVRPRVSELFHAGMIEKTGDRRFNASGLLAHVWKKAAVGAK